MDEVFVHGLADGGIRNTDWQNHRYAGCIEPNTRLTWVLSNKLAVLEVMIMPRPGERPAILIKQKSRDESYEDTADEEPRYYSVWQKRRDTYQQKQAGYWDRKVARIMARIADRRVA